MRDSLMSDSLKKLTAILFDLCKNGFYGSFTIKFEHGKITNCIKEESIKLDAG